MESSDKKARGKRGQGCVYRPKNSRNWWIKFSVRGQVFQETANTESKNEALRFLSRRKSEESTGMVIDTENVTVAVLKENLTKAWEREKRLESTLRSLRNKCAHSWMLDVIHKKGRKPRPSKRLLEYEGKNLFKLETLESFWHVYARIYLNLYEK